MTEHRKTYPNIAFEDGDDAWCGACLVRWPCEYVAPETPEAQLIEQYKRDGLFEVRPEDRDKPWAEQRLQKTSLGNDVEVQMRQRHPDWFPDA